MLYNKDNIKELYKEAEQSPSQVYLLSGERFLCQKTAEKLSSILSQGQGVITSIDGDEEDPINTINKLQSFSLLPGRQIYKVIDSRLFYSQKVSQKIWQQLIKAKEENKAKKVGKLFNRFLAAGGLDPSREDDNPASFSQKEWQKVFNFDHPQVELAWLNELFQQTEETRAEKKETAPDSMLEKALSENKIPGNNFLIIIAQEVDKRKKLFKYLKEKQTVVDLKVESGSSNRAKTAQDNIQRQLVASVLQEFNKKCGPMVVNQLLERVGFHPLSVSMETEKLCLSVGDKEEINLQDLNAIVGRTKQDAIFELTGAIGQKQTAKAIVICNRLLKDGFHHLAILSALRNNSRTLLLYRSLMEQPQYGWQANTSYNIFQRQVLPRLKENKKQEFKGHPYALYMQFSTAAKFPLPILRRWLKEILATEVKMKSSTHEPEILLNALIISMLAQGKEECKQQ